MWEAKGEKIYDGLDGWTGLVRIFQKQESCSVRWNPALSNRRKGPGTRAEKPKSNATDRSVRGIWLVEVPHRLAAGSTLLSLSEVDPKGKQQSVVMTEEGAKRASELFQKYFGVKS